MGMIWELAFGGMLLGLLFWELKRVRRSQQEDREKAAAEAATASQAAVTPETGAPSGAQTVDPSAPR